MIIKLHHSGMMVNDLDASVKQFQSLGFTLYKEFTKPSMKAAMLFKDGAGVEFFEFENPNGDQEQMIKKHTAFESDDLEADIEEFVRLGYKLTIPIDQGRVVKRYAYLKDPTGNYIELLEPADD